MAATGPTEHAEERIYDDVREHIQHQKEEERTHKVERQQEYKVDLRNRDINNINQHLKVQFFDVFGEPDPTTHSFDSVWDISYKVYTGTKLWCYRILSLLCAIPAAFCAGCNFACLSFNYIWCYQPCLKQFAIFLVPLRYIVTQLVRALCMPCCSACGFYLSHIRVTHAQGEAPKDFHDIV